jgi:hypothetical protein
VARQENISVSPKKEPPFTMNWNLHGTNYQMLFNLLPLTERKLQQLLQNKHQLKQHNNNQSWQDNILKSWQNT